MTDPNGWPKRVDGDKQVLWVGTEHAPIPYEGQDCETVVIGGKEYVIRHQFARPMDSEERAQSRAILEAAWDAGFIACAHEHMKQRDDDQYPITRVNPYQEESE